jgi:hypothetical protein
MCVIVRVIWAAALNKIAVSLLRPLKMTSVCPECGNTELRMSYKQYILYTLCKIKRDFLEYKAGTPSWRSPRQNKGGYFLDDMYRLS